MTTFEKVCQLIDGLPSGEGQVILAEFSRELQKFSTWTAKATAFREEIGDPQPSDSNFGDALLQWEINKGEALLNRLTDRIMDALENAHGSVSIEKADVLNFLNVLRNSSNYK